MGQVTYGNISTPTKRVYYTGTAQLATGYAFCYDHDATGDGADEADPVRALHVEKPSASNNLWFAGVLAPMSSGKTGPCWVEIIEPGNYCEIYANENCTINTSFITFVTTQWYFDNAGIGFDGRGSAIAKQTVDRSSTAGLVFALLQAGPESGGIQMMTAVDNAASTPAAAPGAVQFWEDAKTLGTGDSTETVADGTIQAMRHGVFAGATMTTNDVDVTVTHHETSDPEHFFLKLDNQYAYMQWFHDGWYNLALTAPTTT